MSITVVIPVFNKEDYIGRAIESVLGQSIPDFELLVVDDGSTDGSANVVSDFRDERVILLSKPNGGEGSARNAGLRAAKSELICFLDADDAWMPWYLQEVLALSLACPAASIMATAFMIHERNGQVHRYLDGELDDLIDESHSINYLGALARGQFPISSSSTCVRASACHQVGLFDESLKIGADIDMWVRLCSVGDPVYSRRFSAIYHRDAVNRSVDQGQLDYKRVAFVAKLNSQMDRFAKSSHEYESLEKFVARKAYEIFAGSQVDEVRRAAGAIIRPLQRHLKFRSRIKLAASRYRS